MYELVVISFIILGIAIVIGLLTLLLWLDRKRPKNKSKITKNYNKKTYPQQPKKSFVKSAYYEWEQPKEKKTYNAAKDIGDIGEEKIKYILNLYLQENKGCVINDYRGCINNETFQIDHILITPYQILCIETKNYSGKIYGSYYDMQWTITYNQYDKEKIYNPIKQNQGHIKKLKQILGNETPIENIIVFIGEANIEEIKEYGEIYSQSSFINHIYNLRESEIIYNYKSWDNTLKFYQENITDEEHIKNIKQRFYTN